MEDNNSSNNNNSLSNINNHNNKLIINNLLNKFLNKILAMFKLKNKQMFVKMKLQNFHK